MTNACFIAHNIPFYRTYVVKMSQFTPSARRVVRVKIMRNKFGVLK
jgi:hypothetical protein